MSQHRPRVARVAADIDVPYVVLAKIRLGDHSVQISVPEIQRWYDCTPVLVDDIISTAQTMIVTLQHIKDLFKNRPVCRSACCFCGKCILITPGSRS